MNGRSFLLTGRRSRSRIARPRRAFLPELLEPRQLLDAGGATLVDDLVTVHQNQDPQWLNVMANDEFDVDYAGARQISAISFGSEGGFVKISEDRSQLQYAPPADFSGVETFTYFVDGQFFARVDVTVQPALHPDEYVIPPDGQLHDLQVLDNDPFWAGYTGPKVITLASVSSAGSDVDVAPDGKSILYRPTEEDFGIDQFVYVVDEIYPGRVTVRVPQTLANDRYEIIQNTQDQPFNVLANDPFWPGYSFGQQITSAQSSVEGATVEVTGDGRALRYTPPAGYSGWDSIHYVVDDRFEAYAEIVIHRPVQDDWQETDQDSTEQVIWVTSNDRYWGLDDRWHDVIDRVTEVGAPESGGVVQIQAGGQAVIYTPPRGFSGTDRFTYLADGKHEATVTMQVTRPVRDDWLDAYQDTPNWVLDVMANDFLGNGYTGPRLITEVSATEQGATVTHNGRSIIYTPPAGFTGSDSFTYTVDDELQAHVGVWVRPLADGDYYRFCADPNHGAYTLPVLSNDHFQLGYTGPARITSVEVEPDGPTVTISPDGRSLRYQPSPHNYDYFSYTVDGKYQAGVSVSISGHLASDQYVVDQNSDATPLNVLQNDFQFNSPYRECRSDAYPGPRRITGVSPSEHGGVVQLSQDGRSLTYTPAADFVGADQFTYTVDGIMQSSVTVNVIRRVRDDQYRVAPGAQEELRVLVNDLFGADYRGGGQITDVTPSKAGAQLTIADDGGSIWYTAPQGFNGTDTFIYTVDGALKAEVQVQVRAEGETLFPVFDTLADYEQFLIDDALQRYEYLFGQPAWYWYGWEVDYMNGGPEAPPDAAGGRDHSETNVQVEGVDEGDIVEFDSDYIYMLTGQDLVILDAWPATELAEISRTEIEGTPIGQFLKDDRLTVISRIDPYWPWYDTRGPWLDGPVLDVELGFGRFDWMPYPIDVQSTTIVTVFDVTDRAAPAIVQKTTLEGSYIESRAVGDFVYVVLSNQAVAPPPLVIQDPPADDPEGGDGPGVYETKEQYLERFRTQAAEFVQEALPDYASYGTDGELARSGLLHEPEDIFRPITEGATNLVSLVSLNVTNSEPGLAASSGVYTNGATKVYASLDHFYVFEDVYSVEDGTQTRILKFQWDGETGEADFAATGTVAGWMLNQFSADEYDDHLRIATTIHNSGSGNWTGREENSLFVLRDDGGVLEGVGSLQNLALEETIRSVRFMGPRAFLVTFRNVDPLFGLDLSDHQEPRSLGHLTLPGFSSYMQLIDEDHLLTVGRNTPLGNNGPVQVSLFDVSDLTQPRQIDEYTFERFTTSEAAVDHHAFGYFARHGLFAVPSTRGYVERIDQDGDGYRETRQWVTEYELMVFRVDVQADPGTNQGLTLVAEITHDSPVRRSGYIDDTLFSIADNSVHAMDVAAPDVILATADDLLRPVEPPPEPVPVPLPLDATALETIGRARTDLAGRLTRSAGDVMTVTAEPSAGGWQMVLRVDEQQYFYQVHGQSVQLLDDAFEFVDSTQPIVWQNPDEAADTNGDGEVAPNDAILIISRLNQGGNLTLPAYPALRQIDSGTRMDAAPYWDVNGDGYLSPIDALFVIDRLNQLAVTQINLGGVDLHDPSTVTEEATDRVFGDIRGTVGDSNLDGIFNSSDLVKVFQAGEYEDGIGDNSSWGEGDWDGDRDFTSSDLVLAFQQGNYSVAARLADIALAIWGQADES